MFVYTAMWICCAWMLLIDQVFLAYVLFAGCLSIMLLPNGPV